MSGSDRGYIAAAVFGLATISFGAGAWLTASRYDPPNSYPHYQAEAEKAQGSAAILRSNPTVQSAVEKEPCQNPQGSSESDLCAQWRAAEAAENASSWALVQMVLSAAGLVGLLVSLWFTRDALKTSHDLIDLEKRPFLVIRPVQEKELNWSSWEDDPWHILFKIENVGRGPGFLYVFRLDQPERGLHLALPEKDAPEYNYHRLAERKN